MHKIMITVESCKFECHRDLRFYFEELKVQRIIDGLGLIRLFF